MVNSQLVQKESKFSVDWERGISGVMHSTGKYERIEVDFQHNIPLGLMRDIYYRSSMKTQLL